MAGGNTRARATFDFRGSPAAAVAARQLGREYERVGPFRNGKKMRRFERPLSAGSFGEKCGTIAADPVLVEKGPIPAPTPAFDPRSGP